MRKEKHKIVKPIIDSSLRPESKICETYLRIYDFLDSQVFAEEVEPTGAVPIEMSLERYRYAALPNKFKEMSDDQRLQPRVMLKFFSGSHILSQVNTLTTVDWRVIAVISCSPHELCLILYNGMCYQDKTHLQRVLNQWYGSVKQCWRLIYRASTDGFSAEAFHRHCDGTSPTYVLVLVINCMLLHDFIIYNAL